MAEPHRRTLTWIDFVWLAFLLGLALLQPLFEIHKQITLLALGVFQIFEQRFVGLVPRRGRSYSVLIKIVLASAVVNCTGGIDSSYYLIYYFPIVTAAMYFDAAETLIWTLLSSISYLSFLFPALVDHELTPDGATELAIRNLFFFLAAIVVNRFVSENRRQAQRYRELAEALAETNRQLAQVQEEKRRSERLAALGQLSAGLAHEIRNPLGVIKGSAEMLNRKLQRTDALTSELAGYISSEVNRLNTLVTRFLDFARPWQLRPRPEPIAPIIERALKSTHDRYPQANVNVEREFGGNLPEVSLDADMCEQVFTNLFMNAYEAMENTGGTLRVEIAPSKSDGRNGIGVEVSDSGPGIPPDLRQQIFNPFFTTKQTGVGLGLSIVAKIIDDHNGWIRLENEPGWGASFRVFLPAD